MSAVVSPREIEPRCVNICWEQSMAATVAIQHCSWVDPDTEFFSTQNCVYDCWGQIHVLRMWMFSLTLGLWINVSMGVRNLGLRFDPGFGGHALGFGRRRVNLARVCKSLSSFLPVLLGFGSGQWGIVDGHGPACSQTWLGLPDLRLNLKGENNNNNDIDVDKAGKPHENWKKEWGVTEWERCPHQHGRRVLTLVYWVSYSDLWLMLHKQAWWFRPR